jgi:hypothetical protein
MPKESFVAAFVRIGAKRRWRHGQSKMAPGRRRAGQRWAAQLIRGGGDRQRGAVVTFTSNASAACVSLMKMTFLSTVEAAFEIEGRGCVIFPGVPPNDKLARKGAPIELRKPDGSIVRSEIVDMEMLRGSSPDSQFWPILLPHNFSKSDVPVGTEVWLCVDGPNAYRS